MVGRVPQWESRRIRHPIPRNLPGYMLTPYVPPTLLYQFSTIGTIYCIDLDNGQIVSEGQPSNFDGANVSVSADTNVLASASPSDGTLATAWTASLNQIARAYGALGRQGDTSILFAIVNPPNSSTQEQINDISNGPGEFIAYTTTCQNATGQTHWYFARKNDGAITTIPTSFGGVASQAGIDCDRAGNWFVFCSSGPQGQLTHTLIRQAANGSGFLWAVNPDHTGASVPAYAGARTGKDKLVCVGPPELDSGIWHQNVFVATTTGWLSKHDCRTGGFVTGGATTLTPSQLNATPDGLVMMSGGKVTKVELDTLAIIWQHDPTKFTPSMLLPSRIAVDGCGDVIYTTGADPQGAFHIRKIKGADGTPLLDKKFFLPISVSPIVAGWGRIGGYSFCGESWVAAGKPPIAFS